MISSRWSRDDITLSKFWLIEALWWSGRAQRRLAPRRGGPYGGRVVSAGFGRLAQLLTSSTSHQVWMKFKNFKKGLWMSLEHFQTRSWKSRPLHTTSVPKMFRDVNPCDIIFPSQGTSNSPHTVFVIFVDILIFLKCLLLTLQTYSDTEKKKTKGCRTASQPMRSGDRWSNCHGQIKN